MKYVGILNSDVIVAKAISYISEILENEIELTEYQYNTIPIPCRLVDGEFVPCDFPEVDVEIPEDNTAKIETGSYTGSGASSGIVNLTFSIQPKIVFILGSIYHVGSSNANSADRTLLGVFINGCPRGFLADVDKKQNFFTASSTSATWREYGVQLGSTYLTMSAVPYYYVAIG